MVNNYALVGYKFSYIETFGSQTDITQELNRSVVQKVLLQAKLPGLSGDTSEHPNPAILELSYTSNKNKFNDGTWLFAFTKAFDTLVTLKK